MNEKRFDGKAIYNPSGKAGEYSSWACNFYTGCSNGCTYCYCRKGVMSNVWSDKPRLKKCFKDEDDALSIFEKELLANITELRKSGLFFTFTSDPMLVETMDLTIMAIDICMRNQIPVTTLTKVDFTQQYYKVGFSQYAFPFLIKEEYRNNIAFGFTLTGHDEIEPGASNNEDRITAMRTLHEYGFKTWASIEPIVDLESSLSMIRKTIGFCDLYKIGLMSGKKYDWRDLRGFMLACTPLDGTFYFKDSFVSQAGLDSANLPDNCVGRDYNIFNS